MSSPIEPNANQHQNHAVLEALRSGGVCGTRTNFYDSNSGKWLTIRRVAARIGDLRNMGWNIPKPTKCDMHDHPESRQIVYRLETSE